ncbi:NAD(P)/FAD-dependent oxidoreductase [Rhodoligotrophos defluvii]|uniref:NAD(P)/FAD-dependent oxidoreductase n=1 Tax=Rhodoligotrophos defluvii TaxID=2561934 RepID=UPI0010C93540|nr:NAD(P)/FAD-dependent oxidoreductase [Rhodoligotrophos defluvii]
METVDCVVVGAGVVGLAVARALARSGRETIIVEACDAIGTETSSRNSEVIHAGIYYPQGSLKARTCMAGRDALYAYAAERGIPHARCGKLIVATSDAQVETLKALMQAGAANGVTDLRMVNPAEVAQLEPALRCVAAIHSPSTGIIDSHALMQNYLWDAEAAGAVLALNTRLAEGRIDRASNVVEVLTTGSETMWLRAKLLVNAAGLDAWEVAATLAGYDVSHLPPRFMAKGSYFVLAGRSPFKRLVYPVPEDGGLGVHVTLDLAGQARFGPDVEWVTARDYSLDPRRADVFYAAVRRYWPALPDGALLPGYAGIRPKISGPGQAPSDFMIQGPSTHGCAGLINLFGIESPGLTASLDLADRVAKIASNPG